jgi:hypothetical protein
MLLSQIVPVKFLRSRWQVLWMMFMSFLLVLALLKHYAFCGVFFEIALLKRLVFLISRMILFNYGQTVF